MAYLLSRAVHGWNRDQVNILTLNLKTMKGVYQISSLRSPLGEKPEKAHRVAQGRVTLSGTRSSLTGSGNILIRLTVRAATMGFTYELVAHRPYDELLSDIGHSGSVDLLRRECEEMVSSNPGSNYLWALKEEKGSYMLAMVMRNGDSLRISYFLAFPLDELEALYWVADDGEIAELEEELEEFLADESIDWVGGHLGTASGPLLLRTRRVFDDPGLPEVVVGIKIREERALPVN